MQPRLTSEKFRRVYETRERAANAENEIRVTASHGQQGYIAYAIAVLNGEDGKTKNDTVTISGMGGAIYSAVNIAEIVKRRVAGLHQIAEIDSEVVKDEYEPLDRSKNPDNVTVERRVSTILITLSLKPLDAKHPGYQAPIPEDQVTDLDQHQLRGRRGGRGGVRGGRGGYGRGGRGSGGSPHRE